MEEKNLEFIDDLSFSNLVNEIQGEEIKAADILTSIAREIELRNDEIRKLEQELGRARSRKGSLISGVERVMQHLKKEYPLYIKRKDFIVLITEDSISIQRNVI